MNFGLVAAWGRYPIVVAEALRRQGYRVICVGVRDHADAAALRPLCDEYRDISWARLGEAIRYFRRHGVRRATLAGKFHKVRMFRRFAGFTLIPDWTTLKTFYAHLIARTKDRRDDTLLSAIVNACAERGITLVPATDFAPELLVKLGQLSGGKLTAAERQDIDFGWRIAKELGRLDIGQCAVVKGRAILAVEAVEGTDECIRRAGQLCPTGGFTVVKVAKPQQDMRFDVPTIGLGTLETLAAVGGRVLAVEAGKTIIVDEPEVVAFAQRHKITVVAVTDGAAAELRDAA